MIAGGAARTHTAVDDGDAGAVTPRRQQEIRPEFALGQHDQGRIDLPQRPAYGPGKIEGIEKDGQVGEAAARFVMAGVRRGGNDANAENNHQLDVDRLIVSRAEVGRAIVMRRFQRVGAAVRRAWRNGSAI